MVELLHHQTFHSRQNHCAPTTLPPLPTICHNHLYIDTLLPARSASVGVGQLLWWIWSLLICTQDFFRAAQTCIRFFDGTMGSTATSYSDLFSRLDYLGKASSHIEAVIVEKKSSRGSTLSATSWLRSHSNLRRKSSEEMHHTSITLSELTSHVNTINLQIEVTNFLHKCCSEGGYISELRVSNDEKLPTLFGNGHAKAELAIQVCTVKPFYTFMPFYSCIAFILVVL